MNKEEFCKATRTREDCWIFREADEERQQFWEEGDVVCFDNGKGTVRRFIDKPEYEEVWITSGGLWSTWKQY